MLKSFEDFLNEASAGNYVAINATDFKADDDVDLHGGVITPEPHVTLIFSKGTDIAKRDIQDVLKKVPQEIIVECVDIVAYKNEDTGVAAVVISVDDGEQTLQTIHNNLKEIGLKHGFDEYEPHLTYAYKVPNEDADKVKNSLKNLIGNSYTLTGWTVEEINDEWV